MKRRQEHEEDEYHTKRRTMFMHFRQSLKRGFPDKDPQPLKRHRSIVSMIGELKVESENERQASHTTVNEPDNNLKTLDEGQSQQHTSETHGKGCSQDEYVEKSLTTLLHQRTSDVREAFKLLIDYLLESQRLVSKRLYEQWNSNTGHFESSLFSAKTAHLLETYDEQLSSSKDGIMQVRVLLNRFTAMIDEDASTTREILSMLPGRESS
jgi:hypothetical protein